MKICRRIDASKFWARISKPSRMMPTTGKSKDAAFAKLCRAAVIWHNHLKRLVRKEKATLLAGADAAAPYDGPAPVPEGKSGVEISGLRPAMCTADEPRQGPCIPRSCLSVGTALAHGRPARIGHLALPHVACPGSASAKGGPSAAQITKTGTRRRTGRFLEKPRFMG